MECSRCGSQNIKTFEMAHASYNAGISSWGRFAKLFFLGPGALFIRPRQNSVAQRTAPPAKPFPVLVPVFVFLFSATLIWLGSVYFRKGFEYRESQTALLINALLFVIGLIVVIWDISRYIRARTQYPEKLDEWTHSWICLQCGITYRMPDVART